MDFAECVRAIMALSGERVDVEVWGSDDEAPVAFFSGELKSMPDVELPADLADAVGETAETFLIGEGTVDLWPSRFVSAEPMPEGRGWLEVRTEDALVRLGLSRRPWTD